MKTLFVGACLLSLCAMPAMAAEPSAACEAKRANIEAQITEAKARGRKQELAGLQKALKANKAHCTDASLAAERDKQIKEARRKVESREKSLAEAERKGDPRKVAERKAKLDEARAALAAAEK